MLDDIAAASKQARIQISVFRDVANKRDFDLLDRIFGDLIDVETSIQRFVR